MGHAIGEIKSPVGFPIWLLRAVVSFIPKAVYGIELPWQANIGRRARFPHQTGIVVARDAVIGDDCVIHQNVTIGVTAHGGRAPRIGNAVEIGAGAVVFGDVEIGEGAFIGPNAVVSTNVPPGARVVASPSQILTMSDSMSPAATHRNSAETDTVPDVGDVVEILRKVLFLETPIEADTPLLSSGLVDSLNVVVVLEAIESRYGITVRPDELSSESFDTPRDIVEYLGAARR